MSRRPDYSVAALSKARDVRQPKVGAAWANPDGSISVTLDPFVVLQGGPEMVITLFPAKDTDAKGARHAARASKRAADDAEEEIPF